MSDEADDRTAGSAGARPLVRRALVLSVVFPLVAWFFGSWVGLATGLAAVAIWWLTRRPGRIYWPVAVALVASAPFATWVQGLPRTSVVGADFGARHWLAYDMVIAALTITTFAALIELLHLEFYQAGSPRPRIGRSWSDEPFSAMAGPGGSSTSPSHTESD